MDNFNIHRIIGKGAEGTVYEVSNKNGERLAIKRKLLLPDQPKGVSLLNGIDIQRSIKHPFIVPIINVLSEDDIGDFLIVYPLASDSLDNAIHIDELNLTPDTIIHFMWEISLAVCYLHTNGIIHRDLKTANILIFDEGDQLICKVTDFGLSKYHVSKEVSNTLPIVTVNYRAPELFDDNPYYGHEIDIWSLGCIFYELVFRKLMIQGKDDRTCYDNVKKFKLPDVRDNYDIRDWIDQYRPGTYDNFMVLLNKMVSINPADRPTINDVLNSPLFKSLPMENFECFNEDYQYCFSPNPYRKEGIIEIAKMYKKHITDLRALHTMFMAIDIFDRALNDETFVSGSKSQIFFLAHTCNILASRYYCTYKINTLKISNYLTKKFGEDITEKMIRSTQSYIFERYTLYRETLFERVMKGLEVRMTNDLKKSFGYQPYRIIFLFLKMSSSLNYKSYQEISNMVLDNTILNLQKQSMV